MSAAVEPLPPRAIVAGEALSPREAPSPGEALSPREVLSPSEALSSGEARSPYIVSRWYDWTFFLAPPLLALAAGALIGGTPFSEAKFRLAGQKVTWAGLLIGTLIHGHLAAVFVRSHGNLDVFRRHPVRFVVVPALVFAAMLLSMWAVVLATVLVVFWDVYHSALQTFGLGRIYDRSQGNDPAAGRRLDYWLNLVLYAGPILAGATMLAHFQSLDAFEDVGAAFFTAVPVHMASHHRAISWAVIAGGAAFLGYYGLAYRGLRRRGYKVSRPKVFLYMSTGFCSIYAWGFNPWGQAFFIMNLFHAVQYLALVWWTEGSRVTRRLRLDGRRAGRALAAAIFLGGVLAYGCFAELAPSDDRVLWSLTQAVALMHFWYDGFIWSVTRKHV